MVLADGRCGAICKVMVGAVHGAGSWWVQRMVLAGGACGAWCYLMVGAAHGAG